MSDLNGRDGRGVVLEVMLPTSTIVSGLESQSTSAPVVVELTGIAGGLGNALLGSTTFLTDVKLSGSSTFG